MTIKKSVVSLVFCVVLLSGCAPQQTGEIPLGGVFALSGVGATIGQEEERGARLAVEEINQSGGIDGMKIRWIPEDISIDKMRQTPAAVQKLVELDGVEAIIGPTWDEPAAQMLPMIEEAQVPLIMPDATNDLEQEQSFVYGFSTWHDNAVGLRELLRFAQARDMKRVAIIRPTNGGFWQYTADILHEEASNYNVEIIQDHHLSNPLEKDFRTPLTQVKNSEANALFAVVSDYNQCGLIKQMVELDLDMPLLATESAGNPQSIQDCPDIMEERLFFSTPKKASGYGAFASAFAQKYGVQPKFPSAATAYDAVMVWARAYEEVHAGAHSSVREALAATADLAGASSDDLTFDQIGFVSTPENGFVMMEVRGGAYQQIDE